MNLEQLEFEKAKELGVDLTPYMNKGFTFLQLREIRKGIQSGVDVEKFASSVYDPYKMLLIRDALESGCILDDLDLFLYNIPQLVVLIQARKYGADIDVCKDPRFNSSQMEVLLMISEGNSNKEKDLEDLAKPELYASLMQALYEAGEKRDLLFKYLKEGYSSSQVEAISHGFTLGVDITPHISRELPSTNMLYMANAMSIDAEYSYFLDSAYSEHQLLLIWEGLAAGYDVSVYAKPDMLVEEMEVCLEILHFMHEENVDSFEEAYMKFIDHNPHI